MTRACHRWSTAAIAFGLAMTFYVASRAAPRPRATGQDLDFIERVGVEADKPLGDIEVDLDIRLVEEGRSAISGQELQVGTRVVLCFRASERGHITVWNSQTATSPMSRIYPFEEDTAESARVGAGETTCLGEDDDEYRLRIQRPLGDARVLLYYSRTAGGQPKPSWTVDLEDLGFCSIEECPPPSLPYASASLRYRVVDRR